MKTETGQDWKELPIRTCENGHEFRTTRDGIKCAICDLPLNSPKIEKELERV